MAFEAAINFFKKLQSARSIPEPAASITLQLPKIDAIEDTSTLEDSIEKSDTLGFAEGQTFIIEYVDAKKNVSTRGITVWGIKEGAGGMPLLMADCHQRKASRTFRIDRIQTIFDFDGEIAESVSQFLIDSFGMHPLKASLANHDYTSGTKTVPTVITSVIQEDRTKPDHKMNTLKGISRKKGVHLLWCFANADGEFHPTEFDVIKSYCFEVCKIEGILASEGEMHKLGQYIKRIRPTGATIDNSVESLSKQTDSVIDYFLLTCVSVAEADGIIHPYELTAINTISNELVGHDTL